MLVATASNEMAILPVGIGGRYREITTWTGAEVALEPRLSVATAMSVLVPRARLPEMAVALKLKGAVVKVRSRTFPLKTWTLVTLPSESVAEVRMATESVFPKTALLGGLVMLTLGGELAPGVTVMLACMNGWGVQW